jgi:cobalt-precorrin 5A hydrolase
MGVGEAMIVAGVGCRKGACADEIAAAVAAALARAGLGAAALDAIATSAAKGGEAGITAAASALGARLVLVSQHELEAAGGRVVTKSPRVAALAGVPSVAEAAALAVAGSTGRLIVARIVVGPATCALAETAS